MTTDLREKVARVIDPSRWRSRDLMLQDANASDQRSEEGRRALRAQAIELVLPSLAKADAILNLIGGDEARKAAHKAAYMEGWNDREDDLIAGINRVMPIGVSGGWRLIPLEPTEEMCAAFLEAEHTSMMMDPLGAFEDGYRAMIAASPPPQEPKP